MLRLVFAVGLVAGATSAAAEDWRLIEVQGGAPNRVAGLLDYDSVDRSDPSYPRIRQALLYETPPAMDLAGSITTHLVDCAGNQARSVHVEGWDSKGETLISQAVDDDEFEENGAGTPAEIIHLAACEDIWYLTTPTDKMSLDAVARELFGS